MGEVCDGMGAMGGKLNYLGMDCAPAKSTAGDGLPNRSEDLFRQVYQLFYLFMYIANNQVLLHINSMKVSNCLLVELP